MTGTVFEIVCQEAHSNQKEHITTSPKERLEGVQANEDEQAEQREKIFRDLGVAEPLKGEKSVQNQQRP